MVFGKAANLVESNIVHFNSSAGGSPVGGFSRTCSQFLLLAGPHVILTAPFFFEEL